MRILQGFFVLALLCLPCMGRALEPDRAFHHYVRDHWSVLEGLPQGSVACIAQDSDGYLWAGTQSGLTRFDGVRFVHYTPGTEPGLPGILIRTLHRARDGKLWIGTYEGATIYDGGSFSPVPAADAKQWPALDVTGFAEDAGGRMWVATGSGLFLVREGKLHAVPGMPKSTTALLAARDGSIWVGRREGEVHRLTPDGRWQALPIPGEPTIVNRFVEAQGRFWAGTGRGLFTYELEGWRRAYDIPQLTSVELLHADIDGTLWAGGDTGLARIRQGRVVERISPTDAGGITMLRAAFEDHEGNLWMGSRTEGLFRLTDSWTRRFSKPEGLEDPLLGALSPDPDRRRIWVASEGVSVLEDGRFKRVIAGDALPYPRPYSLLAEAERLWIGTRHGISVVEHAGVRAGQVQRPALFAPLSNAQVGGIVRTDDGDLWLVTSDGLYRLRDGQLRRYAQADGLSEPRTRYFHRSRDGRVLVGTRSGLFEMRGERFHAVDAGAGLPPRQDVIAMAELKDGRIVIGSKNERIYLRNGGRWHELGPEQGLPANAAFYMVEHAGFLWVAGISGITRVPVADLAGFASGQSRSVRGEMVFNERGDPRSGQQGLCCNGAGHSKGFVHDGSLWLPTDDGILELDIPSITGNPVPPNAVIERVQMLDQWHAAGAIRERELSEDARDLSFEFTVLSLQDPKSTGVEYRLSGYDRRWRAADPLNRIAQYTNLPPDDYVFEVRGSNNAGMATLAPAQLAFSIQPRFLETSLFKALVVLTLATLFYLGYRLQRYRHRVGQRALERVIQQRTEALQISYHRLELANGALEEASLTDPLTGLRNRRYIINQVPTDLAYYDRRIEQGGYPGEVIVFAVLDIDHFKRVNDEHGHSAGDKVLVQVARILGALVRTGDYVARWGGEEFLMIFRPMPMEDIYRVAERLISSIATHPFDIGEGTVLKVSCSVGLSEYPLFRNEGTAVSWEYMIDIADHAVYYVKEHGRNGWAAFRPTDTTNTETLMAELLDDPAKPLSAGRLRLIGVMGAGPTESPHPDR